MVTLTWSNLLVLGEGESIEEFLWNSDIASVIFTQDPNRLKNTLFALIAKFEKYAGIQGRCFQLLQDCHLLSPPGIKDEEFSPRYDAILRSLSSWIGKVDVVLPAFELLSMVADRAIMKKRAILVEDGQLLYFVNKAITQHHNSVQLQRAALQLYEAILEQVTDKRHLKSVAAIVFKPVLDNLVINDNDLSIAFSSLTILITLTDHAVDMIKPWSDQLINMAISIVFQHSSPEVVSKSIILIDKLAAKNEALYAVVNHERGLMIFADVLATMDAGHIESAIIALELLLRILEDYDLSLAAFRNTNGLSPVEYATEFQIDLKECFDRYLSLLTDIGSEKEEEVQYLFMLHSNIEEILDYMMKPVTEDISPSSSNNHTSAETLQVEIPKLDDPVSEGPRSRSRRPSRGIMGSLTGSGPPSVGSQPSSTNNSRRPSYSFSFSAEQGNTPQRSGGQSSNATSLPTPVREPNRPPLPTPPTQPTTNFHFNNDVDGDRSSGMIAARNSLMAESTDLLDPGCASLSEDAAVIEAEILPPSMRLTKDVPVVLPNAIDCQPVEDDVVLPDDQFFLSGNAVDHHERKVAALDPSVQQLQSKLKQGTAGQSLSELAKKMGRRMPNVKSRKAINLSSDLNSASNRDSKNSSKGTDNKLMEEMRVALKFATFQLEQANQRSEMFQTLFRNTVKNMESLVLENEKLKNKLHSVVPTRIENSKCSESNGKAAVFPVSTVNKSIESSKHSLCVGGLIEGLEFIGSLKVKSDESDDEDEHRNSDVDKDSKFASSSNPLNYIDELEAFSSQICQLFNLIIETYYIPDGKSDHTVSSRRNTGLISSHRLRNALMKMNLVDGKKVDARYLDFIFAYLNTDLFTVSGVAFILIYCGKKKFSNLSGIDLIRAIQEIVSIYLIHLTRIHQSYLKGDAGEGVQSIVDMPLTSKSEFKDILVLLGQQEATFISIFKAYASRLKESTFPSRRFPTLGSRTLSGISSSNSSTAPSPASSDGKKIRRISEDSTETEYRFLEGRKLDGLTFQDVIQITNDFQICPKLISRLDLHQIFYSVACDETSTKAKRPLPHAPFSFYLDNKAPSQDSDPLFRDGMIPRLLEGVDENFDDDSSHFMNEDDDDNNHQGSMRAESEVFKTPSLACDSRDELLDSLKMEIDDIWELKQITGKPSLADEQLISKDIDPSIAQETNPDSMTINFRQFLDFIVLVAVRSPVCRIEDSLKAKVNSLLHLMNMSSGKVHVSRRLHGLHQVDPSLEFRTAIQYHPSQDDIVVDMSRSHSSSQFASVFGEMAETYGTMDSSRHFYKEFPMPRHVDSSYYDEDKEIQAEDFYAVTMTTDSIDEFTTGLSKNVKLPRPMSISIPPLTKPSKIVEESMKDGNETSREEWKSLNDRRLPTPPPLAQQPTAQEPPVVLLANHYRQTQSLNKDQLASSKGVSAPVAVATMLIDPAAAPPPTSSTGKGFFSWFGGFGASTTKVETAVVAQDEDDSPPCSVHLPTEFSMDLPSDVVVGGVSYDDHHG